MAICIGKWDFFTTAAAPNGQYYTAVEEQRHDYYILTIILLNLMAGKKEHRTAKNLYIVNLAISGISMCLICIPPTLSLCIYGGKWFLGEVPCKLVPAVQGSSYDHVSEQNIECG